MIVPALLTNSKVELEKMLTLCQSFTDYVQVDIMDGEFVPSKSITQADLENTRCTIESEAHLMVKDPLAWLNAFKALGTKRIIYHFEIEEDHSKIIGQIRKAGFEVGLAVNPYTETGDFNHLIDELDSVLFMSVIPGFYGSKFIPEVLDKIMRFKKIYPKKLTGIDGGVKLDNLAGIKASGVDYVCV
ncbi:MAG: ribulose-phosphate 3-epimerase, partial [Candidatus Omnitrophica bacterium]|nr:ribulose-phosphate 3-epimerase [Candidatus Omnitrophota bacterium]